MDVATFAFNWVCLVLISWLPIDLGMRAERRLGADKPAQAALLLFVALALNVFLVVVFNAP